MLWGGSSILPSSSTCVAEPGGWGVCTSACQACSLLAGHALASGRGLATHSIYKRCHTQVQAGPNCGQPACVAPAASAGECANNGYASAQGQCSRTACPTGCSWAPVACGLPGSCLRLGLDCLRPALQPEPTFLFCVLSQRAQWGPRCPSVPLPNCPRISLLVLAHCMPWCRG